jgi:hypothetical protein
VAGKYSMNIQHYKKGQIVSIDRHNRRINKHYSNDNIDPAHTQDNITLVKCNGLLKDIEKQIDREVRPYGGRITANTVYCTEAVFTLPEGIPTDQADGYFRTILDYFQEHDFRVLSAVVHLDETTPHMHADFSDVLDHKMSRSKIWNKSTLIRLHDEIPQYLQEHGFQVERGECLDRKAKQKAKRDIHQYKADMLEQDIRALEQEREELLAGNEDLALDIAEMVENRDLGVDLCR